jgi:hypothetical protein
MKYVALVMLGCVVPQAVLANNCSKETVSKLQEFSGFLQFADRVYFLDKSNVAFQVDFIDTAGQQALAEIVGEQAGRILSGKCFRVSFSGYISQRRMSNVGNPAIIKIVKLEKFLPVECHE